MNNTVIMDKNAVRRTIIRLSHEVLERNADMKEVVLVGIKRGGEVVANRVRRYLAQQEGVDIPCAGIDIGMYRDDLVSSFFVPDATVNRFPFDVTDKTVVLCDDVLHTGRSVRAAIEGLFSMGRPKGIQLLILVDRGGREVPVRADFVGKNVPTSRSERIEVDFEELGAAEDRLYITKLGH